MVSLIETTHDAHNFQEKYLPRPSTAQTMNFSRTVAPYKRVRLPPTNDMQYFGNLSEQSPLQSQYCFDTSADAHFSFRTSWEPTPMDMLLSGSSLYDFQQQIDPSMSPPPIKQEASEDECDIPETPGINDDTQITSMQSWQEDPTGLSGEFDVQSGLMILSREQTDQLESQLSGTPRSEGNGNEFETSHDTSIPSSDVASRDMFHVGHSFQPEVSDHYWHPPVVPAYPYAPAQAHLGSGPGSNPLHSSSSATTNLQFPSDHFYVVSFGRKVSQDSDADLRGGPFRGFLDADPNFPEPSRHPSDNLDDELNHKIPAMPPGTGNYTVQQAYARSRGSEVASLPSGGSTSAGELNLQISGVASLPASAYNPPRSPLRRKSKRKLTIQPSGESSEKAPRRSAHRRKSPSAEGTDSSSPPKKSPRDEDLGHIPKSFKVRFKPRKEELESQSNDRAVQSVKSWYNRLNEYDYFYQSQGNGK